MSPIYTIAWVFKPFETLTTIELYTLLRLRTAIFVVEQACIFQDMDGTDDKAMHLLGWRDGQLIAYARCFAAGSKYLESSISRVLVNSRFRGVGNGYALMQEAIARITQHWGAQAIRISAQVQLKNFYMQHGFIALNAPYREDGIEHTDMLRAT